MSSKIVSLDASREMVKQLKAQLAVKEMNMEKLTEMMGSAREKEKKEIKVCARASPVTDTSKEEVGGGASLTEIILRTVRFAGIAGEVRRDEETIQSRVGEVERSSV